MRARDLGSGSNAVGTGWSKGVRNGLGRQPRGGADPGAAAPGGPAFPGPGDAGIAGRVVSHRPDWRVGLCRSAQITAPSFIAPPNTPRRVLSLRQITSARVRPTRQPAPSPFRLAQSALHGQLWSMAKPLLDFSHLSPEQRLQLIEELWDSLTPQEAAPLSPELAEELDRRVAEMEADPTAGRPWEEVLADLRKNIR